MVGDNRGYGSSGYSDAYSHIGVVDGSTYNGYQGGYDGVGNLAPGNFDTSVSRFGLG